MIILDQINQSRSSEEIKKIIDDNIVEIYDILNQDFKYNYAHRRAIQELLTIQYPLINNLDYSQPNCRSFIEFLLEISINLGLAHCIQKIKQIIVNHSIEISTKLKVVLKYVNRFHDVSELIVMYDDILELIDECKCEVDSTKELSVILTRYFLYVLYNFGEFNREVVISLQNKIKQTQYLTKYSFLSASIIDEIIALPITNFKEEYLSIQKLICSFLDINIIYPDSEDILFIENITKYSTEFISEPSFETIQVIANKNYPKVYEELSRGVAILDSEEQMFQYIKSYGFMHKAKLISAFSKFDFTQLINRNIEVIDWGCGQGFASVILSEYLAEKGIEIKIKKSMLIEPSQLCLKRGALHVKYIMKPDKIETVLSALDGINLNRLKFRQDSVKIHLFSNILDIEDFSLSTLISNIKNCARGQNIFFCVSPYVNDFKSNRINAFMGSFSSSEDYEVFVEEDSKNSDLYWNCIKNYNNDRCRHHGSMGCSNKWKKLIRVFKCTI